MSEVDSRPSIRFGRTLVTATLGDLLSQEVEAVVLAANCRGVLGPLATPGLTSLRTLGGSVIEREAMARAPLNLGSAIVTGATGLEERGVRGVVHAVVHPALGERARIEHVRRAVPEALIAASNARLRSLAVPLLGVESRTATADLEALVAVIVDEMVGSLRRAELRLDRVVVVCRFPEELKTVEIALARARERVWLVVP
ncbi:MAG: macro domain-containing protein [Thermomicrobiales bacterium]|nr:macro domain-containing protein [Thermomicrobiales bacterium]